MFYIDLLNFFADMVSHVDRVTHNQVIISKMINLKNRE